MTQLSEDTIIYTYESKEAKPKLRFLTVMVHRARGVFITSECCFTGMTAEESRKKAETWYSNFDQNRTRKIERDNEQPIGEVVGSIKRDGRADLQGTFWYNHPQHGRIRIRKEQFAEYIALGYKEGRGPNNKNK